MSSKKDLTNQAAVWIPIWPRPGAAQPSGPPPMSYEMLFQILGPNGRFLEVTGSRQALGTSVSYS